jgi:formylglycine-generating enzyme required for sulfatase activity
MADIFISYAREDKKTAQNLAKVLESRGWSVWYDPRLKAGEIWNEVIERELEASRSVVVLWSSKSVKSRWVRKEARYGDTNRFLFPALIEPADIPFEFSDVHAEDLIGWNGAALHPGVHGLFDALVIQLGEPTPVQKKQAKGRSKPTTTPSASRSTSEPEDLPDLSLFRDIDESWCPEMVVLPRGEFKMGSPHSDTDATEGEKPQHKVKIAHRFAIGRHPVVVCEYARFVAATGRRHEGGIYCWTGSAWEKDEAKSWRDPGFTQTSRYPVAGVSWEDAGSYVRWLADETGKDYRLLTEAEWEYACRGGTTTRYSFGDSITHKQANFGMKVGKTSEVGSYPANNWGLHDMHGNVWEWVADCYEKDAYETHRDYPAMAGSWQDTCHRVLRGGSWSNLPRCLRSAHRDGDYPVLRYYRYGFRIARTIDD